MKIPREAWWIAGLTVVMAIIAGLLGVGREARSEQARFVRTTYYTTSEFGLRALYLTLDELGYQVRRYQRPFNASLPDQGTMVVIDPIRPLLPPEWRALRRWVEQGHTLLLAGNLALPFTNEGSSPFSASDVLATEQADFTCRASGSSAGLHSLPSSVFDRTVTYARPTQPTYLSQGVSRLAIRADAHLIIPDPEPESSRKHKGHKDRLSGLVEEGLFANDLAEVLRGAAPVFRDDEGAVVSYARVGRGTVILLGSPYTLANEGIAKGDNLIFALNALGPASAGPIYFDEYHHGFGEGVVWGLLPLPVKVMLAQLLLAFLVLAYARSRRFGRIIPLGSGPRERSEFLGTMTALLRKGGATRLALRTAHDGAVHRLRQQLGLPAEADGEEIARAAARVNPESRGKLKSALERAQAALTSTDEVPESRAMTLIRELDAAEKAVRQI